MVDSESNDLLSLYSVSCMPDLANAISGFLVGFQIQIIEATAYGAVCLVVLAVYEQKG